MARAAFRFDDAAGKAWLQDLSPAVRRSLSLEEAEAQVDASSDYIQMLGKISENVKEHLRELCSQATADATPDGRFGIVECADGEWSVLRLYKSSDALAHRIGQLDGSDTVVWCFFGVPIQITQGTPRYLLLEGSENAICVQKTGKCSRVPVSQLEPIAIQHDGFLGPDDLVREQAIESRKKSPQ